MFLNIFKIGGSIVDNDEFLAKFCSLVSGIPGKKVIVHGGGSTASAMCRQLGIDVRMHEGRRITDEHVLKVVVMIYGGWVNKRLVARLQANAVNAVGLTGADGNSVQAHRRTGAEIDYGFVGDIDAVNKELLNGLVNPGLVPVIAPLTHDGHGQLLNTNADTMAAQVAAVLSEDGDPVRLVYLFDRPGVLRDLEDDGSALQKISVSEIDSLRRDGIIADGMLPKLHHAKQALEAGVKEVLITNLDGMERLETGTCTNITLD